MSFAKSFVNYLNENVLIGHLDLCHKLELDSVNSAYSVSSHIDPTKVKRYDFKSLSERKLGILQPPPIENNFKKYLFQVQTKPNNGIYEFNVVIENKINRLGREKHVDLSKSAYFDKKLISRVNEYGHDEHCIHDTFPDLRKYCYCKDKQ